MRVRAKINKKGERSYLTNYQNESRKLQFFDVFKVYIYGLSENDENNIVLYIILILHYVLNKYFNTFRELYEQIELLQIRIS